MVEHIYCINLERSPERREKARAEFEREGLDVEFFRASDGKHEAPEEGLFITKSEWGCAESHIRVWKDIIYNGYETALVFEDDVVLAPDFVSKLNQVMSDLPPDWDFVNIGACPQLSIRFAKHTETIHVGKSLLIHAYLIRLKCVKKWADADASHLKDGGIDTFMANYPSYNLFLTESLAHQTLGSSTIGLFRTHDYSFWFQKWGIVTICAVILIAVYIHTKFYVRV